MANSYTVQAIESTRSALGEGPHWDIARQSLYYVDQLTDKGTVHRYDPATDETFTAVIGKPEHATTTTKMVYRQVKTLRMLSHTATGVEKRSQPTSRKQLSAAKPHRTSATFLVCIVSCLESSAVYIPILKTNPQRTEATLPS